MTKPVTARRDEDEFLACGGCVAETPYGSNILLRAVTRLARKYKSMGEKEREKLDRTITGMLSHYAKGFEEAENKGLDSGLQSRKYERVISVLKQIHPDEKVEEMACLYPLKSFGKPGKY